MTESNVTVVYKNTYRDILSFNFFHFSRSPSLYLISGIFILAMTIMDFHALASIDQSSAAKVSLFIFYEVVLVVGVVIFWTLAPVFSVSLAWFSKKNKILAVERTVQLREDSFMVESIFFKSEIKWNAVQKLVRTRNYIYLYTARSTGFVIPRRVFAGVQEWDSFFEFCKKRTIAIR